MAGTLRAGVAGLILVLGVGCAGGSGSGEQDVDGERDTVTLQVFQQPPNLDLTRASVLVQPLTLLHNVYETLVTVDDTGEPQPMLAESWDLSEDGRTYTFTLREATFHNGDEFTADDVVYTFERNMKDESAGSYVAATYDKIAAVEAVDDRTVRVTLKKRNNRFLTPFQGGIAGSAGAIIPEGTDADTLQEKPLGTGPFQVRDFVSDKRLTLARFDDYWGDEAAMREVTFRFIPDDNSAVNALQAGDIDGIASLTSLERAEELQSDPQLNVVEVSGAPVTHLLLNVKSPKFEDPKVRQAIVHAIDQQAFVDAVRFGFGYQACGWLPNSHTAFREDACQYEYDPEKSRRLLEEAGAADLSFKIKANPVSEPAAQLAAAQLQKVGIDASVEPRDDAGFYDEVFGGDFEASVIGYTEDGFFTAANCPPGLFNGYCNKEVGQLLAEGDAAPTSEEAVEAYAEANDIIIADAMSAELFGWTNAMILPAGLKGYRDYRVGGELYLGDLRYAE